MRTSDFDYSLPDALIAQTPIEPRDHSRLMVLNRADRLIEHRHFYNIVDYLEKDDVIVFNDSRVIPARLQGQKSGTSTKVELLLLRCLGEKLWEALARPGKKLPVGTVVLLVDSSGEVNEVLTAEVIRCGENGIKVVRLSDGVDPRQIGQVPLPPYIHASLSDPDRYQTVYARVNGSVAAPTAGLHFTPRLLEKLENKGVKTAFVTLHIGLDTFRPVRAAEPDQHPIHTEYGEVNTEAAALINHAINTGKRIIAVGTSTVRLLESSRRGGSIYPYAGWVKLFILPGYEFKVINAMVTNFHLPKSTPLMLVSAFAGREFLLTAYKEAVAQCYRFYSFGDAMLIL